MMNTSKKMIALLSGAALLASSSLFAGNVAPSVSTDPVGYVTVPIKVGTNVISNSGLLQSKAASGSGDVTGGNTLTVSGASFEVDGFAATHYVQFVESGKWSPISSNDGNTLSLEYPVADGSDLEFVVRPLNTLSSLFGANNGVGFTGGSSFGSSDKLFIWGANEQAFASAFYYNTTDSEWQDASNQPVLAIIYPDESLLVVAKNEFDLIFTGSVQDDATSGTLVGGNNTSIVPNPFSADIKITETGLENVLQGAANFGSADKVFVWGVDVQTFASYYYYNTTDSEWQTASNVTVTGFDVIPVGGAAIIVKKSEGDVEWTMTAPY